MCKKCEIDYPLTNEFYTTHKGKIRTHLCRPCHQKILRERYKKLRDQGYRLKMVKDENKENNENKENMNPFINN
jgi:hypothetical protein